MKHTDLLAKILERAEAVKNEFNSKELCAFHIAVAFAEFCSTEYTGFSVSDNSIYPNWYEEERLRFIYGKVLKNSSYFRLRLSKASREGEAEQPFDFTQCERFAALRENDVLSADLVLLCVLKELMQKCRPVYRILVSDDTITPLLEYIDANIYDYTARSVQAVCDKLMEKANRAAAKRDWRPAAKFAEPDELGTLFFEKIEKQISQNSITLRLPKFFGAADLKLSIHKVGDIYYVHDNGCAIRHLAKRVNDKKRLERALKKVCHSCWINGQKVTGSFTNAFRFIYYLQMLVFVAHADLYYTKAETPLYYRDKDYVYLGLDKAEPIDEAALLDELKKGINFCYDEDQGLYCWLDTRYSTFSGRAAFLIETLDKGLIRISDGKRAELRAKYLNRSIGATMILSPIVNLFPKLPPALERNLTAKMSI